MKTTLRLQFLLILMTLLILSNEGYAQSYERRSTQFNSQRSEKVQPSKTRSSQEIHRDNTHKSVKPATAAKAQATRERTFQAQAAPKPTAPRQEAQKPQVQEHKQGQTTTFERRANQSRENNKAQAAPRTQNKVVFQDNNRTDRAPQGDRVAPKNNGRGNNRVEPQRNTPSAPRYNDPPGQSRPNHAADLRMPPPPKHNAMPPFRPAPVDRYYGYRTRRLPREARRYTYAGLDYYFLQGVYYRLVNGFYRICRPPVGAILDAAAVGTLSAITVALLTQDNVYRGSGDMTYAYNPYGTEQLFYQDGIFLVLDEYGQYIVVDAPIGARVPYLPQDYKKVKYDGRSYYEVDYTLYRPIRINGEVFYEVVGMLQLN